MTVGPAAAPARRASTTGSGPRLRARTVVGALVLALAGGGCAPGAGAPDATGGPDGARPSETASSPVEERTVAPSRARRVGAVRPEAPETVRLPGVTTPLAVKAVDTRPDGLLDVPPDVDLLGWWEGGSRVGDPFGSVLLAGHVDSETQGLGPSAALLSAEPGERVSVRSASRTTSYRVVSRRLVPLDDLASYPGVVSSRGPARLTLVTCAPPFVEARGGYQNLAVVTAYPVTGSS